MLTLETYLLGLEQVVLEQIKLETSLGATRRKWKLPYLEQTRQEKVGIFGTDEDAGTIEGSRKTKYKKDCLHKRSLRRESAGAELGGEEAALWMSLLH